MVAMGAVIVCLRIPNSISAPLAPTIREQVD